MNLPASILQFPLAAGIEEGADEKTLAPGTLRAASNVAWNKDNRLDKRAGTTGLTKNIAGGGTVGTGKRLVVRGDELAIVDGSSILSYSGVTPNWQNQGPIAELGLTWSTLINYENGVQCCDVGITSDGRIVTAWVSGDPTAVSSYAGNASFPYDGAIFVQVIDRAQDSRLVAPAKFVTPASCTTVRVLIHGTDYMLVWDDGANIKCAMNGGAVRTLRTDAQNLAKPLAFDACALGANFAIAYEKTPVANISRVDVYKYSFVDPPVQQATAHVGDVNNGGVQSFTCLGIDGGVGDRIWVGWGGVSATGGARGMIANIDEPTLASVSSVFNMWSVSTGTAAYQSAGVCRVDATHAAWSFSATAASIMVPGVVASGQCSSAGTISAINYSGGVRMLSRPFLFNAKVYVALTETAVTPSGSNFNPRPNSYLACIEADGSAANIWVHRLVGKVDVLIGAAWRAGFLTGVAAPSSTEALVCLPFQGAPVPQNASAYLGPQRNGVRLVSVTAGASLPLDMWRSVQFEREAFIGAGVLQAYDGRAAFDYGFHNAPALDSSTSTATTGGSIANGTYLYSLIGEFVSATGMLYRSPVLPAWSIVVPGAGAGSTTLKIVTPALSPKQKRAEAIAFASPVLPIMALHRSTVGQPSLYRETAEPRLNVVIPDYSNALTSFLDTRNDSDIGNATKLNVRAGLYTAGGELDDHQPPSCLTFVRYRTRLALISGDKRTVWISKDYSSNVGTAPGWHPSLTVPFQEDLTALGVLDEKLVIFSRGSLWFFAGDGPGSNGQGSDYGSPIKIQSDVGCTSPRSVVAFPDGLIFQSVRGLYILTRGLEVKWLGKRVMDTLASFPTITSAVLVPAKNQVRFTCNNTAGTSGVVLVYDYVRGQWSTFKFYDADAAVASTPIADAILYNDVWTFLTPGGKVYKETDATYLDDSTGVAKWVTASFELAQVTPSGPLGFQRIRRAYLLGDLKTACDLSVAFDVDGIGTYPQSYPYKSDKLATMKNANIGGRVGALKGMNPRCRSFSMKFADAPPSASGAVVGTGQGCTFSAVGFEIVPKTGLHRRAARARV